MVVISYSWWIPLCKGLFVDISQEIVENASDKDEQDIKFEDSNVVQL